MLFVVNGALTSKRTIKACQSSCFTHVPLLKTGPLNNSMNFAEKNYSTFLWAEERKLLSLFSYIYGCDHHSFVCNWYIILSAFALMPNSINPFVNSLSPMLLFFISCFSFILLSNSPLRPLLPWESETRLLSPWFWRELWSFLVSCIRKGKLGIISFLQVPFVFPLKMTISSKVVNAEEEEDVSLLDLPELALECILQRLSPSGLCSMARVCTSLRDRCRSDHLWEKHMKQKWGRVIGPAAYREWQWHIASRKRPSLLQKCNKRGLFRSLFSVCPLSWIRPKLESSGEPSCSLSVDSIKAWYLSLESGKLWFPAQVYNRENGHLGFVMSCYDALLSYDSRTDTFRARYSPQGPQTIEENIPWHRLRAPPIDVPPHVLHVSDCLNDLKPGDHIEIQWRKNKELPYGWWYGIISHLETCNGNENHCCCHNNGE